MAATAVQGALTFDQFDQERRDAIKAYLDFLDDDSGEGVYSRKVREMIAAGERRLVVNVNELRRRDPTRTGLLLSNTATQLSAFQLALKEYVGNVDSAYARQHDNFFVGLEGSFGGGHVTPRTMCGRLLGGMVCVEGIVIKTSLVNPKVTQSVHYCPNTKKMIQRRYQDALSVMPSSEVYPTKDEDGNLLETEFGLSTYKDHQTFTVQELPERAPPGQLPRSVDVVADDDLADMVKPGDRVQVVGLYTCLPSKKMGYTNGAFRTVVISNNIHFTAREITPSFTAEDVAKIKKFSQQKSQSVFNLLARSLAPSIYGHEQVKQAILCLLLGGVEKILDNGSRIRGDINMMLIGDPSVAKSQLLRFVLATAPLAIATTGRGSSGVGLTAAVTHDQETGERRLEAGAMVLADRGIVCIDEFDKMTDVDRTAIHEVMEQGRVTIAKAGVFARLNARCSVLAAANPVYGKYDQYKTPMENIGLQDSLLSRFDMLFILLDNMDPEVDARIADHVLKVQRYVGGDLETHTLMSTLEATQGDDDEGDTPIYDKSGAGIGAGRLVHPRFMKKYLHIARTVKPILTEEAANYIAEEYTKLRGHEMIQDNVARTQPVTARSLETMVRVATAHAKCRLSKKVERSDAEFAVGLMHYAYFKTVLEKKKRKRKAEGDEEGDSEDEDEEEDAADPYAFNEKDASAAPAKKRRAEAPATGESTEEAATGSGGLTKERTTIFRSAFNDVMTREHVQSLHLPRLTELLAAHETGKQFSAEEIKAALGTMSAENKIMISNDVLFLI